MKKMVLFMAVCLCGLQLFSQKVVENPRYLASTADALAITRIELQDTCTILDFCYTNDPGASFRIPQESYITASAGGEKFLVKQSQGVVLNEFINVPESGEVKYRLVFPPIDQSVPMIDFGEGSASGSWFIYNLELIPQVHQTAFPDAIRGNWFRTDGSREWVYGFQDQSLIFDSGIYQPVTVTKRGKGYEISLTKDGEVLTLYARPDKKNGFLIGTDPKKQELFSREPIVKTDFVIAGDEEFKAPITKPGVAKLKGYVTGYLPKIGTTATAYVSNIFANSQEEVAISLQPDGSFEADIPLDYPHTVYLDIAGGRSTVFIEPGKSVFQLIDRGYRPGKTKVSSLFMGELARINSDLQALESLQSLNYTQMNEHAATMTQADYIAWMLDQGKQMEASLERYIREYPVCRKALQVKRIDLACTVNDYALLYKDFRRNSPEDVIQPSSEQSMESDSAYYFLPADELNNPVNLISNYYDGLLNQMIFFDKIRSIKGTVFSALLDSACSPGWKHPELDRQMLTELASGKPLQGEGAVSKEICDAWLNFSSRNPDLVSATYYAWYHDQRTLLMRKYFRLEPGLVTDLALSQMLSGLMNANWSPLNEYQISLISKTIKTPEIRQALLNSSKKMEMKLAAMEVENRNKKGYWYHESPDVPVDSLFGAIMAEHKGKLLFVDFWATWCSPCKAGIQRMRPLKEEYLNKNVDFIYITGPSSPQNTYDLMIPDIKGQHYRVTKEGWSYLCKQFKITGIPHYMLVDQLGNIVGDDVDSMGHSNELLKSLFDKYLKR